MCMQDATTGDCGSDRLLVQHQLTYWKRRLAGASAALDLHLDDPPPHSGSPLAPVTSTVQVPLPTTAIAGLAAAERVAAFSVVVAAVQAVLARYAGAEDICVATPSTAGSPAQWRTDRPLQRPAAPGPESVLVLRGDLSGDPAVSTLLRRTEDTVAAAFEHRDVPLPDLLDALGLASQSWAAPSFCQVVIAGAEGQPPTLPGGGRADLFLQLQSNSSGPGAPSTIATAALSSGRFSSTTLERFLAHVCRVLVCMGSDPDRPLSQLELLTETERQHVLLEWNDTTRPVAPRTAPELFAAQAARDPKHPALRWLPGYAPAEEWSYAELDRRANQLARWLVSQGVGPGSVVALLLPRSVELILAELAVMTAGAAFLPVDPRTPVDRIAYLLEDAAPTLVLTGRGMPAPETPATATIVDIAMATGDLAKLPGTGLTDSDRRKPARSSDPAYIIYTSGSTGRPKAVVVTHNGVASLVATQVERLLVGPGCRVLQFAPSSFDAAFWELCMSLLAGATLVLAPTDRLLPGRDLAELVNEAGITHLTLPPSALMVMPGGAMASVTTLTVAGETCPPLLAQRWAPGRRMINAYGPTESTVCATMSDPLTGIEPVLPIGRPVVNTQVYVLDPAMHPVPHGVTGELHLAGAGLARGYLNRPELTADRFVRNPFGPLASRLYRTGDLVRWRQDGQLEFVGRNDDQIKVRGYRVEPGEVEESLLAHDSVAQAAVVARGETAGEASGQLVAYLVPAGDALEPEKLRRYLTATLPEYMIPATYVQLAQLPTTPSGKVDRRALPPPPIAAGIARERLGGPYEQAVGELFADVLGLPVTGLEQEFFAAGGNSLLAVRLVDRVRDRFGVELSVNELFQEPTVAALARRLADSAGSDGQPDDHERVSGAADSAPAGGLTPWQPSESATAPLTFGQEQLWFLEQLEEAGRAYRYQHTIRFSGQLRVGTLRRALTEVVRRHTVLHTTYLERDCAPVQRVNPPYPVNLPVQDLRGQPEAARERCLREAFEREGNHPFPLDELPLVRWRLYRTGEHDWTLLETGHHVLHDGWSVAVMWQEVEALYCAEVLGRPTTLPEPTVQLTDYAVWQRERYARRRSTLLDYWRQQLVGVNPLDLPFARRRPPKQTFGGATHRVTLPIELYERLRRFSRNHRCSLYMTMLAAYVALLHRYTGSQDICVGSWMANREDPYAERLVGMLVNMVAMRNPVRAEDSFLTLLDQVRQTAASAFEHQDAPFHEVVRAVQPERDTSRNPIVQTCFSFHDSAVPELAWPGVSGTLVEQNNGSAKFDLNVIVVPHAEQRRLPSARPGHDELAIIWEYNTDLLDRETVARVAEHYEQLLRSVLADSEAPISAARVLPDKEQRLLASWQGEVREIPGQPVHELVFAQASATPQAVAVRFGDRRVSYRELLADAARLAGQLQAAGVGPGELVAVCQDRSPRIIASLLAIMAVGAAYVPLDLRHPAHRNQLVLRSAAPAATLVDAKGENGCRGWEGNLIRVADAAGHRRSVSTRNTAVGDAGPDAAAWVAPVTGADRAYVLFTSGTTGRPKGVEVTHGSLVNLLWDMRDRLEVQPSDVLTAITTISFDIAALELLLPLVTGAQVDLATEELAQDSQRLREHLGTAGTTIMQATPTTWQLLVESGDWPTGRRFVAVCGGERCPADLAHELRSRTTAAWNVYGPTETTIWSTAHRITQDTADPVPIGRPLANTACQVLDRAGRQLPVDVPGELHIGGAGVALGYLGLPELTKERFGTCQVTGLPEQTFRTGDIARWVGRGELEFLGRMDRQVKVRGLRIEPAEVESAILEHPDVRQAAVVPRTDRPVAGLRLVGFVVCSANTIDTLYHFLAQRLPRNMVPDQIVSLRSLPTTPNGKIDRAALATMDVSPVASEAQLDAADPESAFEARLSQIWAEVLGLPSVDRQLSFFESGGHSLLAMRLVARVRSELNVDVSLTTVLEHPSIAELSALVDPHS